MEATDPDVPRVDYLRQLRVTATLVLTTVSSGAYIGSVLVTWTSLFQAAAALVAAGYVHGLLRLADAAERTGLIARRDWVVLAALLFWILLLIGALRLIERVDPSISTPIAASAILGMAVGKLLPRPGHNLQLHVDEDN